MAGGDNGKKPSEGGSSSDLHVAGRVCIIGTGAFAQGLASMAQRTGAGFSYSLCMASRRVGAGDHSQRLPGLETVPILNTYEAVQQADLVLLAVPCYTFPSLMRDTRLMNLLAGKTVVDVSNPSRSEVRSLATCAPALEIAPSAALPTLDSSRATSINATQAALGLDRGSSDGRSSGSSSEDAAPAAAPGAAQGGAVLVHLPALDATKAAGAVSAAEWLQSQLEPYGASVVKGFSNLSAYALLNGDPLTDHMRTVLASNCGAAARAVQAFAAAMSIDARVVPRISYARTMEGWQGAIMPDWQIPALAMLATFLATHLYASLRYNAFGTVPWRHNSLFIVNKSLAWTSLWGMLYCLAPGLGVTFAQLFMRRPQIRIPRWLKTWMDGRKQLGVLAAGFLVVHTLFSVMLFTPSYYPKFYEPSTQIVPKVHGAKLNKFGELPLGSITAPVDLEFMKEGDGVGSTVSSAVYVSKGGTNSQQVDLVTANTLTTGSMLNWFGEANIACGCLAAALMLVMSTVSLPCNLPKMTWGEFRLMFSHAHWLAFCLATAHVMLFGVPFWHETWTWAKGMPTISLMSTAPCMLIIAMKLVLMCPPVPWLLEGVRSGRFARPGSKDTISMQAVFCKEH